VGAASGPRDVYFEIATAVLRRTCVRSTAEIHAFVAPEAAATLRWRGMGFGPARRRIYEAADGLGARRVVLSVLRRLCVSVSPQVLDLR
jgi:hypothetical protein